MFENRVYLGRKTQFSPSQYIQFDHFSETTIFWKLIDFHKHKLNDFNIDVRAMHVMHQLCQVRQQNYEASFLHNSRNAPGIPTLMIITNAASCLWMKSTGIVRQLIFNMNMDDRCRICHEISEAVQRLVSACPALMESAYFKRNDGIARSLYYRLIYACGLESEVHPW